MAHAAQTPPKWGSIEMLPLPARFNAAVRDVVAARVEASGRPWKELVFAGSTGLFSRDDAVAIEEAALADGVRFDFSATVSLESEPEKYKRPERAGSAFSDGPVVDGRRQVGVGDNVIQRPATVRGPVALVSTTEHVMAYLTEGVPEGTIAVIDDSGGTLTAPIIEGFAGVICLGGSVRSHLGILAREYGVPTLMNVAIDTLADGDEVEIEVTADPPASDAYETGDTGHARIWKIEER
jgi:phosphohistidine swiveling domain-containing protein